MNPFQYLRCNDNNWQSVIVMGQHMVNPSLSSTLSQSPFLFSFNFLLPSLHLLRKTNISTTCNASPFPTPPLFHVTLIQTSQIYHFLLSSFTTLYPQPLFCQSQKNGKNLYSVQHFQHFFLQVSSKEDDIVGLNQKRSGGRMCVCV